MIAASFDPGALAFEVGGIRLAELAPLVDGQVPETGAPAVTREGEAWRIAWLLAGRERFELEVTPRDGEIELACRLVGFEASGGSPRSGCASAASATSRAICATAT